MVLRSGPTDVCVWVASPRGQVSKDTATHSAPFWGLTLPPALLCCPVSRGTKQHCLSCTLNRGSAPFRPRPSERLPSSVASAFLGCDRLQVSALALAAGCQGAVALNVVLLHPCPSFSPHGREDSKRWSRFAHNEMGLESGRASKSHILMPSPLGRVWGAGCWDRRGTSGW